MAVFTVGTPGLVNHGCYYGRLSRVFPILLSAPETSEGIWNLWHFFFFILNGDQKAVICRQKCNYQLNGNRNFICGSTAGLFLLSVLLFSLRWIYFTFYLYASFHPELILRLHLTLFFLPSPTDYKSLLASDAGAAARTCSVHKLHPFPVSHPRSHRLLHLQGLVAGLHGEPDAGPAGLSRRRLHHRASLPHQHRDVPGHESQVFMLAYLFIYLFIYFQDGGMAIHVPHRKNHTTSGNLSLCATLKFIVQREYFINYWMDFWELALYFQGPLRILSIIITYSSSPSSSHLKVNWIFIFLLDTFGSQTMSPMNFSDPLTFFLF